jgi:N12 class adenine-specific DNA methylase
MPQTASERAFDMFLKVQYIQKINNGGGVIFATGTPIANSVAEMFTMQR